jgi:hypothetical protein
MSLRTVASNGQVIHPWLIDESIWGMCVIKIDGQKLNAQRETFVCASMFTTNPTYTAQRMNLSLCSEKMGTA